MTYSLRKGDTLALRFRSGMTVTLTVTVADPKEQVEIETEEWEFGPEDGLVKAFTLTRVLTTTTP